MATLKWLWIENLCMPTINLLYYLVAIIGVQLMGN